MGIDTITLGLCENENVNFGFGFGFRWLGTAVEEAKNQRSEEAEAQILSYDPIT